MQTLLVRFYRAAFLRQAPRRYAVMQPQTADRKYDDFPGALSDQQIAVHLDGRAAYAVPTVENGLASLLPLDIDAGGIETARALLAAASARGLWAFAQVDAQRGRGYVWIPFDDLTNAARLHTLGAQLIAETTRPGWKVENRATAEDTRLPFARHTWTGRRGQLITQDGHAADLDGDDYTDQLATFAASYHENPTDQLPLPLEERSSRTTSSTSSSTPRGVTIASYNARTDLADLLEHYGARPARGRGARLFFCPFHGDDHASLLIARDGGRCRCLSQGSACPLADHQHDAFNVFCIGEGLTTAQALRRLNGHPDNGTPPTGQAPRRTNTPQSPQGSPRSTETAPAATIPPAEPFRVPTAPKEAVARDGRRLPKTCRRILAAIRAQGGHYWRGVPQLARLLDCDPRTVQRSLRRLETEGLLYREQRGRDGHTDIYREEGRQMPPTSEQNTTHTEILEADKGGQTDAPQPTEASATPISQADADGAHHGPAGALAYPGGAAYVPPEAVQWYTALQAETLSLIPQQPLPAQPQQAEIVSYDTTTLPEPSTPPTRRRRRTGGTSDPARLTGRIIAATRKVERLERSGKARDRAQARAIRRSIETLERQRTQAEENRHTSGYTAEECDEWHHQRAAQTVQGAAEAGTPPLTSSSLEYDVQGLIERLRVRDVSRRSGQYPLPGALPAGG